MKLIIYVYVYVVQRIQHHIKARGVNIDGNNRLDSHVLIFCHSPLNHQRD